MNKVLEDSLKDLLKEVAKQAMVAGAVTFVTKFTEAHIELYKARKLKAISDLENNGGQS